MKVYQPFCDTEDGGLFRNERDALNKLYEMAKNHFLQNDENVVKFIECYLEVREVK